MFAGWRLRDKIGQSIPSGVETQMTFNSLEEDSGGFTAGGTPWDHVVIPPAGAGLYLIGVSAALDPGAAYNGYYRVVASVGGADVSLFSVEISRVAGSITGLPYVGMTIVRLTAGMSLKVMMQHSFGSAQTVLVSDEDSPVFWGAYIGA